MAETTTENRICGKCGVEVRPGSMFCYNCGGGVSDAEPVILENPHATGSLNNGEKAAETSKLKLPAIEDQSETVEEAAQIERKPVIAEKSAVVEKPIIEEAKLKSAATMRRQAKSFQKKNIEVVWEEPTGDSLPRLLLVTILLLIFVGAIVYAAILYK